MKEIELRKNVKRRSVTIWLISRNSWGGISDRRQFTVSENEFKRALREAEITIPWEQVS